MTEHYHDTDSAETGLCSGCGQPIRSKPHLTLVGEDGNAWVILGRAQRVLRDAGYSKEEIDRYRTDAMSGDYDHLLQVTMRWFDVD